MEGGTDSSGQNNEKEVNLDDDNGATTTELQYQEVLLRDKAQKRRVEEIMGQRKSGKMSDEEFLEATQKWQEQGEANQKLDDKAGVMVYDVAKWTREQLGLPPTVSMKTSSKGFRRRR